MLKHKRKLFTAYQKA